jgi:hypothetical protein
MQRAVLLVLAVGGLMGVQGCRRVATPPTVDASTAEPATEPTAAPEPRLLVPLTQARPRSNVQVELPASPGFEDADVPDRYDDGAYSIRGLRRELDARIAEGEAGQEILVRAFLSRIYTPPECPQGSPCPPTRQPHLWLTDDDDDRGTRRALMVVSYSFAIPEWQAKDWKKQPQVAMDVNKRYTIKGRFKRFSDTGFADDQGLLEFIAYRPHDPETGQEQPGKWVYPRGAPWHPLVIAQQEAANRALAERAARDAARGKPRKRTAQ